jgi:very-short-patch-repair endonuclease
MRTLPAPLIGAPFTSRDARLLGVGSSRLRARDLLHPFHAVHLADAPGGVRELCRAYLRVMTCGAYFSHETAAVLLGIPLPSDVQGGPLHVSVSFPRSPPRGRGITGHSLGSVDGSLVDGLPTCTPAHVWCQLSGILGKEDLVAAGDYLVGSRTRAPLLEVADLAALSEQLSRTKGARDRSWALPRIRCGTDSRPETLLRLFLEDRGLDGLEVNRPLAVAGGRLTLHPDLSVPSLRIAFEYEGDGHRVDRRQWHLDIERRELLEAEGWRVMRVTAADLFTDPATFLARLKRFVPNVHLAAAKGDIRHESLRG